MEASPFSKLPPELRNRIYELATSEGEAFVIYRSGRKKAPSLRCSEAYKRDIALNGLALTATCKQLRSESTQVFYASNDFKFWGGLKNLQNFVAMIGLVNAKTMRSVTVEALKTVHILWLGPRHHDDDCVDKMRALREWSAPSRLSRVKAAVGFCDTHGYFELKLDVLDLGEPWNALDAYLKGDAPMLPRATSKGDGIYLISRVIEELRVYRYLLSVL